MWTRREDDQPFAFARMCAHDSATILTADANCLMRPTHHRMPVILTPDERAAWLDRRAPAAAAGYLVGVALRDWLYGLHLSAHTPLNTMTRTSYATASRATPTWP